MNSSSSSSTKTKVDISFVGTLFSFIFSEKGFTFLALPLAMAATFLWAHAHVHEYRMRSDLPLALHKGDLIYLDDANSAELEILSRAPFTVLGSVKGEEYHFTSSQKLDYKQWVTASSDEVGFKVLEAPQATYLQKIITVPPGNYLIFKSEIGWPNKDVSWFGGWALFMFRMTLLYLFYSGLKSIALTVRRSS